MKSLIIAAALHITAFFSAQNNKSSVAQLFQNYTSIKTALTSDNVSLAKAAARAFITEANVVDYKILSENNVSVLKRDAAGIYEAEDLQSQRRYFHNLSDNIIALSTLLRLSSAPVYLQYCPMAGANWLSPDKEIRNPYYGREMLTCGTLKSEIK